MSDSQITQLVSIKEVSKALGISRATVYRLMDSARLPHVKIGGRLRFVPAQIEAFIESNRVEQSAGGAS